MTTAEHQIPDLDCLFTCISVKESVKKHWFSFICMNKKKIEKCVNYESDQFLENGKQK